MFKKILIYITSIISSVSIILFPLGSAYAQWFNTQEWSNIKVKWFDSQKLNNTFDNQRRNDTRVSWTSLNDQKNITENLTNWILWIVSIVVMVWVLKWSFNMKYIHILWIGALLWNLLYSFY